MYSLLEWIVANSAISLGIAALAILSSRVLNAPALSHFFWLLVLVKLVTPPLVKIPFEVSQEEPVSPTAVTQSAVSENLLHPFQIERVETLVRSTSIPYLTILLVLWGTGSVGWLGLAGYRSYRFNRALRSASDADDSLLQSAERNAGRLKMKRVPEVIRVGGNVSPLLWAFGRKATIVIPGGLWKQLSEEERDTLMTHELAHARRKDHWFRWLEWMIIGLLWWNPIVWWARSGLRKAEEDSCDAWVLWAHPSSAKHYAQALVKTFEYLSGESTPFPIAACGVGERRQLKTIKKRFIMILKSKPSHRMTNTQKQVAVLLAALILPFSGYILHARETADRDVDADRDESIEHNDHDVDLDIYDDDDRQDDRSESIDDRIARLERMLEELIEEKVRTMDHESDRRHQIEIEMERHALQSEHRKKQIELALKEADLEMEQAELEMGFAKKQLDRAQERFEEGRIDELELQNAQHAAKVKELEIERRSLSSQARIAAMKAELQHQRLRTMDFDDEKRE